jgi:hypothetical protein
VAFGVYSLYYFLLSPSLDRLFPVALAAFIYVVAGAEEASVLAEERRRAYYAPPNQGIWTAPPGYHWVEQGNGLWRLAPIIVSSGSPGRH